MDHVNELDNLLKRIKEEHLKTIRYLSNLYKNIEELIENIKKNNTDLNEGLGKIKDIIGEGIKVRDEHAEKIKQAFKIIIKSFIENYSNKNKETLQGDIINFSSFIPESFNIENIPLFKLTPEDNEKLVNVIKNSSEAFIEMFGRMSQIFLEQKNNKAENENNNN